MRVGSTLGGEQVLEIRVRPVWVRDELAGVEGVHVDLHTGLAKVRIVELNFLKCLQSHFVSVE